MKQIKVKAEHEDMLNNLSIFFNNLHDMMNNECERVVTQLEQEGFFEGWSNETEAMARLRDFVHNNGTQESFSEYLDSYGFDTVFGAPEKDVAEQNAVTREKISDRVCEIIRTACTEWFCGDPPEIKPDTTFDSVELDSLDLVELIVEIEDQFDITFPEEDVAGFKTPGDVVNYIVEHK